MKLSLKNRIDKSVGISEELWDDISEKISINSVKKGEILISQGEFYKTVFYIVSGGIVSSYVCNQGNKRATWFFLDEDYDFVGCNDTIFNNVCTNYELKALEDSTLIEINYEDIAYWKDNFEEFNKFYYDILLNRFFFLEEIRNVFLTSKSLDFMKYILQNHPVFFRRVSDYYLSQFFGISPEWFCKLKKRMYTS